MKLSPATLGVAAAVALSLQQSTALSTARDGSTTPTTPSTEPPVCEKDPLTLTISEVDGKAAFRCSTMLPVLEPKFVKSEPRVIQGRKDVKLAEVIPGATLEEQDILKDPKNGDPPSQAETAKPKQYMLTVHALPNEEKAISLKCAPANKTSSVKQSESESDPAPCEVNITVKSSGMSAAFRPAVAAASAVAGLLFMEVAGALQLFA